MCDLRSCLSSEAATVISAPLPPLANSVIQAILGTNTLCLLNLSAVGAGVFHLAMHHQRQAAWSSSMMCPSFAGFSYVSSPSLRGMWEATVSPDPGMQFAWLVLPHHDCHPCWHSQTLSRGKHHHCSSLLLHSSVYAISRSGRHLGILKGKIRFNKKVLTIFPMLRTRNITI